MFEFNITSVLPVEHLFVELFHLSFDLVLITFKLSLHIVHRYVLRHNMVDVVYRGNFCICPISFDPFVENCEEQGQRTNLQFWG